MLLESTKTFSVVECKQSLTNSIMHYVRRLLLQTAQALDTSIWNLSFKRINL